MSLDKLIYTNWEEKEFNIQELISTKKYITLTGLDFGFTNDPTALVVSLCDTNSKEIYIFDEYGNVGMTNPEIAEVLKSMGYSKNIIMADSANKRALKK